MNDEIAVMVHWFNNCNKTAKDALPAEGDSVCLFSLLQMTVFYSHVFRRSQRLIVKGRGKIN